MSTRSPIKPAAVPSWAVVLRAGCSFNSLLKLTMGAGETEAAIQPRLAFLRSNGISPILNYAVEDDVGKSDEHDEAPCDANLARFLKSIADCNVASARGFMAIKVWLCLALLPSLHTLR